MGGHFAIWLVATYLVGALPWSVWLGHWFAAVDPRTVADGNPGAANAFRTAGWWVGSAVLILDFFKAFLPVFVARWLLELSGPQLFWIALAPMIGHAFSVFLRFRGGRGLTALFGVWSGLTLYEAPLVMGIAAILATQLMKSDALKTILLPSVLLGYLLLQSRPDWMIGLVVAQLFIMVVKIGPFYLAASKRGRHTVHEDSL